MQSGSDRCRAERVLGGRRIIKKKLEGSPIGRHSGRDPSSIHFHTHSKSESWTDVYPVSIPPNLFTFRAVPYTFHRVRARLRRDLLTADSRRLSETHPSPRQRASTVS